LPDEWVLGPVRARIDATVSADMEQARRTALAELDGQRYRALLDQLVEFAGEPALTPAAAERADRVVPALVAKAHRRVGRDLRHAHAATDPTAREEAFHAARKVAKRLRYAGEALTSAFGADARRLAERAEAVQEVLGEHQDSVVARAQLREMALAADDARENAFTYGLLVGVERSRAEAVEAQVDSVWKRLDTPKARRLLR
jgi:CHAD domain-containing protein